MTRLIIHNLDEATQQKLRIQAARHGVSIEEEVRRVLKAAMNPSEHPSLLGTRLRNRFADVALESLVVPERHVPRGAPQWDEAE
jgi:plasmid stability protein